MAIQGGIEVTLWFFLFSKRKGMNDSRMNIFFKKTSLALQPSIVSNIDISNKNYLGPHPSFMKNVPHMDSTVQYRESP